MGGMPERQQAETKNLNYSLMFLRIVLDWILPGTDLTE